MDTDFKVELRSVTPNHCFVVGSAQISVPFSYRPKLKSKTSDTPMLSSPLSIRFIKQHRSRAADVQGIDAAGHGNGHSLVTGGQSRRCKPVTFAAEHHAAI